MENNNHQRARWRRCLPAGRPSPSAAGACPATPAGCVGPPPTPCALGGGWLGPAGARPAPHDADEPARGGQHRHQHRQRGRRPDAVPVRLGHARPRAAQRQLQRRRRRWPAGAQRYADAAQQHLANKPCLWREWRRLLPRPVRAAPAWTTPPSPATTPAGSAAARLSAPAPAQRCATTSGLQHRQRPRRRRGRQFQPQLQPAACAGGIQRRRYGNLATGLDPQLGTLGMNGGSSLTRLPAATSPVLNMGDPPPPPAATSAACRAWRADASISARRSGNRRGHHLPPGLTSPPSAHAGRASVRCNPRRPAATAAVSLRTVDFRALLAELGGLGLHALLQRLLLRTRPARPRSRARPA